MSESEQILFHYTSLEGLLGIIESKSIWATNVLYLNDASELNYAVRLLKEQILEFKKKNSNARSVENIYFETLIDNIENLIPSDNFGFFVCSFSEEKDILSQWRGYCPKGIGFSLGFKFNKLMECAHRQGFSITPCSYDEHEQIGQLTKLIDIISHQFSVEIGVNPASTWDLKAKQLIKHAFLQFIVMAPTFKHPKFREEKEWRIISTNLQVKKESELIKFRSGLSMIIPYVEIFLPTEVGNLIINQIVVGPTHDPILSKTSVEMLLRSKNVEFDEVQYSTIPYRNW